MGLFHSARSLSPEASKKEIAKKVKAAIARIDDFKPVKLDGPITMDMSFKSYRVSEMLAYLPQLERINSHTIRYVGKNMIDVSTMATFITGYSIELTP
jgi:D-amino peptidase